MTLGTLLCFQIGQRSAIETIARNSYSILVGMFLVLLTAIARNYDQSYWKESALWLFGPLVFSFFSGCFLYIAIYSTYIRRHFAPEAKATSRGFGQWLAFMGLFWMTAPIAWLYAIPVERFLSSYSAAAANLSLLSIVALWRVLLMARIIQVLQKITFLRALSWVLIGASVEVGFLSLFGSGFSRRLMASMGGMRNAPEENLLYGALQIAFMGALAAFVLTLIAFIRFPFIGKTTPFPERKRGPVPILPLFVAAFAWVLIAIPAQREQALFSEHARLVSDGLYRESIDYLSKHSPGDFPPSRRLEPNPYEYRIFSQLPEVIAAMKPDDPKWIRDLYLDYMGILFSHRYLQTDTDSLVQMFRGLQRLAEAGEWMRQNAQSLNHVDHHLSIKEHSSDRHDLELRSVLKELGYEPE